MASSSFLKLRTAFQQATGLKLGRKIYDGGCAYLHKINGHDDKVVKIVITYAPPEPEVIRLFKYLKRSKNPAVVKLHQYGVFKIKEKLSGPNGIYYCDDYHYYYVMEKLSPLTKKLMAEPFKHLVDGLYQGRAKATAPRSVQTFVKRAIKLKYDYEDLHQYNVMRDKRGSLKFVDLESFLY